MINQLKKTVKIEYLQNGYNESLDRWNHFPIKMLIWNMIRYLYLPIELIEDYLCHKNNI